MAELVGGVGRRGGFEGRPPRSESDDRGARGTAASPETVRVLDALSTRSPRELADIARRCGMTPSAVMGVLGGLEAVGQANRHPFGWLRAKRS
ncbi:helix-turn-helix domain-containing protein [Agromyces sp. Root81]|uniref:DprA-like winged helix domain-containing protein n=1 Tax=Agromyces sp. Root81 TaxID=1736601 RepID=UPI000A7659B0|nr:helix-turn-helix domain-containing protein [Agromyces sp. Root81]